MTWVFWIGLSVILVTIVGVSLGRFPGLKMNRATIAFTGAVILVLIGAISHAEATSAIDFDTITLLLALMILNANFRISGFFSLITGFILKISGTSGQSMFLNDTAVKRFNPKAVFLI